MAAQAQKISEAKIEAKLVKWARDHRVYTRKFSSPAHRGVPDRIFIKDGRVLFMELKRPGNRPTALQLHEIRELHRFGCSAVWHDTYETAVEALRMFFYAGGTKTDPRDLI